MRRRSEDTINEKIATGRVEVVTSDLKILAEAETPPFEINDDVQVGEPIRLKYRYLDLRRPSLQKKLIVRNKICRMARAYLAENGFLEIETPFWENPPPKGRGAISFPAASTRAASTPCPSRPSFISSF